MQLEHSLGTWLGIRVATFRALDSLPFPKYEYIM